MLIIFEILFVIFAAYLVWALSLYIMQPNFLYKPIKDVTYSPDELGLQYENIYLKTSDSLKIHAWFIPAPNADLTVLFCHGNGGNIMHRLDTINIFNNLGINCMIFDYRGYGKSEGSPSENGTYLDAQTAYGWLTKQKNIDPKNIIIFGRSLGGAIASHLTSKLPAKALVLESAFTSYIDIGSEHYPYMPVKWYARFRYPTIEHIKKTTCPIMIIHSRADEIIPFQFGLKLYEAAAEPKEFVEIFGRHNDGFLISKELYIKSWTKWLNFLRSHKLQPKQHSAS